MNPPRWDGPTSDAVREELLRRVADGTPETAPARRHGGALRVGIAVVIALALIVPVSVLAFRLGARTAPADGAATLEVATDPSYTYDRMGDYAGVSGTLHATRHGDRVCFSLTTTVSSAFGAGPFSLVFPAGWSASHGLVLLDDGGREVARPGDEVAVFTTPQLLGRLPEGCSSGTGLGALHVERTVAESTPVAVPTSASPSGCAPNAVEMPRGAFSASVADVDGDGRRDRYWAVLANGDLEFGITTASGATIVGRQGFAGGGARSFVVGRLANGVVVAITSEGRDSPVYTFSGCAFHQLQGKDLLPGTDASSPFTFYSEDAAGAGGCFDGRLALTHLVDVPGDPTGTSSDAVARFVDVSADGLRATLTDETATVATGLDVDTDRARFLHYAGISCGGSTVLFPVVRGSAG